MAANVETMFYTREKPWHGLGTMVREAPSSSHALKLAGPDWKVEQHPVQTKGGIRLEGFLANIRDTDTKAAGWRILLPLLVKTYAKAGLLSEKRRVHAIGAGRR